MSSDSTSIEAAAAHLRDGGLVALPTETVYGLAADASDPDAVAAIYAAKGRPADHPLIVHVASVEDVDHWALDVPDYARELMDQHWPGPLTLVLHRSANAGDWVTGGQDTVAVRMPNHPTGLAVLREFRRLAGSPIGVAAPSANKFGRVSPTSAAHVTAEFMDLVASGELLVVDGGECAVGLESTIVDCTGSTRESMRVLRPGAVDVGAESGAADARDTPRVPGALESHYAPRARVLTRPIAGAGLIALASVPTPAGMIRVSSPRTIAEFAHDLYAALRRTDDLGLERVAVLIPQASGFDAALANAISDRVGRAARGSRTQ